MEAGPRDNEETAVDEVERAGTVGRIDDLTGFEERAEGVSFGNGDASAARSRGAENRDDPLGADSYGADPGVDDDGLSPEDLSDDDLDADDRPPEADGADVEPHELRPPRKLRVWQLAPIVVLSALGSLMFAFPLAFEPGGGTGAVVSMLGLLICGCGAGWAVMAARRVGLSWPGLPAPDSGERPDWRIVALYAAVVCTVVVLAIWRVARLR